MGWAAEQPAGGVKAAGIRKLSAGFGRLSRLDGQQSAKIEAWPDRGIENEKIF